MANSKKKRVASTVAASALVAALGLGGTLAYLTDAETVTNTFTIGDVKIELLEPNYPGNDDEDKVEDLVPNEELPKDPKVANVGVNDTVIFMTVDSPLEYVTLVNDDGTPVRDYQLTTTEKFTDANGATTSASIVNKYPLAQVQEIFWFKDAEDAASTHANNFDSNWTELPAKEMYLVIDRHGNETVVAMSDNSHDKAIDDSNYDLNDDWADANNRKHNMILTQHGIDLATSQGNSTSDKAYNKITDRQAALQAIYQNLPSDSKLVRRYVFAYNTDIQGSTMNDDDDVRSSAKLGDAASERETTTLFEKIQLKNFIENEIDKCNEDIVIRAYAIQSDEILEQSADLGDDLTNVTNLNHIYEIFVNQNSGKNGNGSIQVINLRDADFLGLDREGEVTRQPDGTFNDPIVSHVNRWNTDSDVIDEAGDKGDDANIKPAAGGTNP